jgi:hypothetical protein
MELLILYACVQFYTHQASDYRLSSKTGYVKIIPYGVVVLNLGHFATFKLFGS